VTTHASLNRLFLILLCFAIGCGQATGQAKRCKPKLDVESATIARGILTIQFKVTNPCPVPVFVVHLFEDHSNERLVSCATITSANRPGYTPRIQTGFFGVLLGSDLGNRPSSCGKGTSPPVSQGDEYRGMLDVRIEQLGFELDGGLPRMDSWREVELVISFIRVQRNQLARKTIADSSLELFQLASTIDSSAVETMWTWFDLPAQ
jgi:hypothetical protein